jgi:zinc transport system permease protein
MELWYRLVELLLPFEWTHYVFMKNAFLAVLLVTPLFALVGTLVINQRLAFFSDVLGHSSLTGIALGVLMGVADPRWSMLVFMIFLAVAIVYFRRATDAAFDTVLGVFFAVVVALGVVILSRGGGFARYAAFLIGDVLVVTPAQIGWLCAIFALVVLYWLVLGNSLVLLSVNPVLASTRGLPAFLLQVSFAVLVALVVSFSISLVGILIINSLLILPAAAARNISSNMRSYTWWAITISLTSGIMGLIVSYYAGTATGATIVLVSAGWYFMTIINNYLWKRARR